MIKPRIALVALLMIILVSLPAMGNPDEAATDALEKTIGDSAAEQLIRSYGGRYTLPLQEQLWIDEIFRRLLATVERTDVSYSLTVLNSFQANAFALPGGHIFITRGLLRLLEGHEHAVAAVLGHELAHVEKRHGVNALLRHLGLTLLMEIGLVWLNGQGSEFMRMAALNLVDIVQSGYGREAEFEADFFGQKYAGLAGFDPVGAVHMLRLLQEVEKTDNLPMKWFMSHPPTPERIARMEESALNFWSAPTIIDEKPATLGRTLGDQRRRDPLERFYIRTKDTAHETLGMPVYDRQAEQETLWLPDVFVIDTAWSPDGHRLAVVVEVSGSREIWMVSRLGFRINRWRSEDDADYGDPAWSPDGRMIAYTRFIEGVPQAWIGYLHENVSLKVGRELAATVVDWTDQGVVLQSKPYYYVVIPPVTRGVELANPVPRIVERKQRIAPTIIRDSDSSITLRRPNIITP